MACLERAPAHVRATASSTSNSEGGSAATLSASAITAFLLLVSVKTATDLLTNRVPRPPATATALVAEIAIFPLIAGFLVAVNGLKLLRQRLWGGGEEELRDVGLLFRRSVTEQPGRLLGIGLIYAFDSLAYFFAQSNVGAVTYTVLAQTKIFFTVGVLRARGMLPELRGPQLTGLLALFAGAVLVALKDVATGVAAVGGNRALGIGCLLFGQACTSVANVQYERVLREPGCDFLVKSIQLTGAITVWLAASSALRVALLLASGQVPPPPRALLAAFCAPWVWLVVLLKAATAVLIACTINAGGNVLYAISKPWPVVFATLATCLAIGRVPSLGFITGITLSIAGISLYYSARR